MTTLMREMYWPQLLSSLCQVHEQERLKCLLLGIANGSLPYNEFSPFPFKSVSSLLSWELYDVGI